MRLLLTFVFIFLSFSNCFGEENINPIGGILDSTGAILGEVKCADNKYEIIGDFDTKLNSNLLYSIKNTLAGEEKTDILVDFSVEKNGQKLAEKNTEKFNIVFADIGPILIKAKVTEKNTDCVYNLQKNINVYSKIVSYISDKSDLNLSFDNDFKKNNIFFNETILESKNSSLIGEQFLSQVTDKLYIFQDSDIIIINSSNYLEILQGFEKLSKVYNINFPNKKIFIVTDSSFILSKKLLSNFINSLEVSIYTFTPSNLLNFLNYISLGRSSTDIIKNKEYGINQISFEDNSSSLFFLTNFTNKLISSGFPISILGIIFSLGVAVTVINFIRQFVGISIFNLYYPIFFALSVYLFSFQITLVLFISSILSMYFMKMIYKKVHFLLNTKLSLFFVLYLIISILTIGILNIFNLIDFIDLKSNLVVFPFIVIPMVAYKLLADERNVFSIAFLFYLSEFIFVSLVAYFIIKSSFIQNIFLAYTELLIVVFLINFLIGKFTGLQVLEYIRFLPLIKRHFQEEE
nr:7TM domain-containing protein [Candidatus Gracilibacteria bacterium]